MTSDSHQILVRLVAQKMVVDGFAISHWDGKQCLAGGGGNIPLPVPPKLGRHRPDLVGYHEKFKFWGIGEAKTDSDLANIRTEEQLLDFSSLISTSGRLGRLYIAVPYSALEKTHSLMVKCGIHGRSNISLMPIPDIFL